ncbi:HdeD family acid-resistance protein [Bauldia sp.]|uniref:HdeD family acid-resistance protein n=1 Tax=Bauldia sp. TaxID=2575872 RepID=UPI003BAB0B0B
MSDASATLNAAEHIQKHWGWYLALGIVFLIGGVFAIAMPFIATLAVTTIVGIALAFVGVVQIVQAWSSRSWGGFIWQLIMGLVITVGGVVIWLFPIQGALALTIVAAAIFLAKGVMQLILGFQMRPNAGWGWMVFSGLLAVVIGVLIWLYFPASTVFTLGTLAGISLIFSGWTYILISMAGRRTQDTSGHDTSTPASDAGTGQ